MARTFNVSHRGDGLPASTPDHLNGRSTLETPVGCSARYRLSAFRIWRVPRSVVDYIDDPHRSTWFCATVVTRSIPGCALLGLDAAPARTEQVMLLQRSRARHGVGECVYSTTGEPIRRLKGRVLPRRRTHHVVSDDLFFVEQASRTTERAVGTFGVERIGRARVWTEVRPE